MKKKKITVFLVMAMSCLLLSSANTAEVSWIEGVDGNFSDPARWDAEDPPGADDQALFSVGGEAVYTVTQDLTDHTINKLQVGGGDQVTLILDQALTATLEQAGRGDPAAIDVGFGDTGSLIIEGGGTFTSQGLMLGAGSSASEGSVTVQGADTVLDLNNAQEAMVGNDGGDASLLIQDESQVNVSGTLTVGGRTAGTSGSLVVDNATLEMGGYLRLSESGGSAYFHATNNAVVSMGRTDARPRDEAVMLIDNGATVTTGEVRWGRRGDTLFTVENDGTLNVTSRFGMGAEGGGDSHVGYVRDGGVVNASGQDFRLGDQGPVSAELNIETGGHVTVGDLQYRGDNSILHMDGGTMTVDDDIFSVYADNCTMAFTLHGAQANQGAIVEVGGDLRDFDKIDLVIDIEDYFSAELDDVFTLLSFGGSGNEFRNVSDGFVFTDEAWRGYEFTLDYGEEAGSAINLMVTAIPEPSTMLLLTFGGLLLMKRRER